MGFEQHVGMGEALGRLEAIGGKLDQQAERIGEIDRIHEAAVLDAAVLDLAVVEALDRLQEGDARHRKGDVMDAARLVRRAARIGLAAFIGEDGDQAAVAGSK